MKICDLLNALINISEKGANIARIIRSEESLLKLLVQEKKGNHKNERFLHDFKTLADVLVQELVIYDLSQQVLTYSLFLFSYPNRPHFMYSKTCVKRSLSKRPKNGFQDRLSFMQVKSIAEIVNAPSNHVEWQRQEHLIRRDKVECDLVHVVPGAAMRCDLTHQIKLLK